jgi:hypothetical protein
LEGGREGGRERERERVCSSSAAFKLCSFDRSCRAVSDSDTSGYIDIRGEVGVEALQLEIPRRQKLFKSY